MLMLGASTYDAIPDPVVAYWDIAFLFA